MIALEKIDQIIMYPYLKYSRFMGYHFGATACSLARSVLPPSVTTLVFYRYLIWLEDAEINTITTAFIIIGLHLLFVYIFWQWAEKADFSPNPYSVEPFYSRLFCFTLYMLPNIVIHSWLALITFTLYSFLMASYWYLRAVPNPPPKKRNRAVIYQPAFNQVS